MRVVLNPIQIREIQEFVKRIDQYEQQKNYKAACDESRVLLEKYQMDHRIFHYAQKIYHVDAALVLAKSHSPMDQFIGALALIASRMN